MKYFLMTLLLGITTLFFQGNTNLNKEKDRFQIYNYSMFTSEEEAFVQLYANSNYSDIKFKLFKISDPMQFIKLKRERQNNGIFDIWGENYSNILKVSEMVKEFIHAAGTKGGYWYDSKINLGKLDAGIYLLQSQRGNQVAYCPVVVSNYMMVMRGYKNKLLLFTAESKSGKFQENLEYNIFVNDSSIAKNLADKNGIVEIQNESFISNSKLFVTAKVGEELVFSDPYYFFTDPDNNSFIAYIYTNQPVYRPGQKVHFKSVLRERKNNFLTTIGNEKISVQIRSPKNKEIFNSEISTNDLGTLFSDVVLDEDAEIGTYSIQVNHNGQTAYGSFAVEEYKKPEFKVSVELKKNQFKFDEIITGKVSADYFFGSPVQDAKVVLKIFRKQYYLPWWYWSEYAWFYKDYYPWHNEQVFVDEIEGEIDENGEWNFSYDNSSTTKDDYIYEFIAEVTDNSRRTINGSKSTFVTRNNFSVSINTNKYFVRVNENLQVTVRSFDFAAKSVSTKLKIKISKEDEKYRDKFFFNTLVETNKDGVSLIDFIPKETGYYKITAETADKSEELLTTKYFYVHSKDDYAWYGYGGSFEFILDKESYQKGDTLRAVIFNPNKGASIFVAAETNDLIEKKVFASVSEHAEINFVLDERFSPAFNLTALVVGNKSLYTQTKLVGVLDKSKTINITLEQSKKFYKPGDSISYFINVTDWKNNPVKNAEFSAALVDEAIFSIKEDETKPIDRFFNAPTQFYVPTSNSFQSGYFYTTSRVKTYIDKTLNFIKPLNENSSFTGILKTKDEVSWSNFKLLLISENTIYTTVIDETGLFNFKQIASGDYQLFITNGYYVFDFIKNISVKIGENKVGKISVEFEDESFSLDEADATQDMAGAGNQERTTISKAEAAPPANYVQPEVRQNFVDAAFWNPVFKTDRAGNAVIKIKAPDNLTSWRLTLKGLAENDLFGQKISSTIVRKELLVRIESPRFFRQGDEITISTIVHSYLPTTHKTKISFDVKNLELLSSQLNQPGLSTILHSSSKKMFEVEIESNSEIRIDWKVKVNKPNGQAELYCEALTSLESDAMKISIPVLPKGIKNLESFTTELSEENQSEEIIFTIPNGVDLRSAFLNLSLQPTLAASILQSLDELIEYPYGCVEQTMSRFLPAVIASSAFKDLNLNLSSKAMNDLPKVIDAGLKRLYSFQHSDGGWGWWKNDETNPYMTAYVIFGLKQAINAGYDINSSAYEEGLQRLQILLDEKKNLDETTTAFMIYALSFTNNKETRKIIFEKIDDINLQKQNAYTLSLIGLAALNLEKEKISSEISARLLELKNETTQFVSWQMKDNDYRWQSDNVQATAMALKFFIQKKNNDKMISKGVRWLITQQRGSSWNSTQQTAKVLFALIDYLKSSNELNPDYSSRIILNGKEISIHQFSSKENYAGLKLRFDEFTAALKHGSNTLRIIKNGAGKLYVTGFNTFYADKNFTTNQNNFSVEKQVFKLEKYFDGDEYIYRKSSNLNNIKSGDLIFVKLSVENKNSFNQYVMIEDFFASGFEIVKDDDHYRIEGEEKYSHDYYDWRPYWRWNYADKEIRDEKISFFVTYPSSTMDFTYIMRAQIPGEFNIMPAEVSLMYYPEILTVTELDEIKVKN